MPCPFPGMDPYIERSEIWGDFHWSFAVRLCGSIQRSLRPNYAALTHRLYLDNAESSFQHEIHIVEPRRDCRLVTAIGIATPQIKRPGPHRISFLAKRDGYLAAGVNLVEIDLLRAGLPIVRDSVSHEDLRSRSRYSLNVIRSLKVRNLFLWRLEQRLPVIEVPLSPENRDVPLDLQAVFARSWDEGPYPELLHYDGPPPADLTADEQRWCLDRLNAAGFRDAP